MHGRCMPVLLRCRPWPPHPGQAMKPFPLHSGQVPAVFGSVMVAFPDPDRDQTFSVLLKLSLARPPRCYTAPM
jgi:hypothetical protein